MKGMELPHDFQGAAWVKLGTTLQDGQAAWLFIFWKPKGSIAESHRDTPR